MLLRRIARPMLAGIFVYGGVSALRDPEGHAKAAQPVLDRVADRVPVEEVPSNVTLVRVDAGVKIGAGLLLALGKAPRLASAALATSLVPTTVAAHRFWEIEDPERRQAEQIQFLKNLGLLGGLMLASADTEGKPSLAWRARRAGRTSAATAELFHRDVTAGLGELAERAARTKGQAVAAAGQAGGRLSDVAEQAGGRFTEVAGQLGEKAGPAAARLGEVAGQLGEKAAPAAARLGEVAGQLGEKAGPAAARLGERAGPAAARLGERAGPAAARLGEAAGHAGGRLGEHTTRLLGGAERWRGEADKRGARAAKQARKARKRAAKRTAKRLEQIGKQAEKRIELASKRADKRVKLIRKRAAARAEQVRASLPR
jgi:uncharacterized membrane protein YphA (DoxX/SURF4 family)